MKVIIAGGRDFNDYNLLKIKCNNILYNKVFEELEIVSGTAQGADKLGERYAKENNIKITRFFPKWNELGKIAGIVRNHEMGDYADALIAFWDGKSKGTKDMINYVKYKNLKVRIIKY